MHRAAPRPDTIYSDLLDDACLLMIFTFLDPLPDMFNISRTCWRFRELANDRRMWLTVCDESDRDVLGATRFSSLHQAVQAARPGDRIWLTPKSVHEVRNLVVSFPLILVGGGSHPEATKILVPNGSTCGLDIRSTCKMENLSANSTLAPCVLHRSGVLRIERCTMQVDAKGLGHLCSPLVTVATSRGQVPAAACAPPYNCEGAYLNGSQGLTGAIDDIHPWTQKMLRLNSSCSSADDLAAVGRLFISDTQLSGGESAVQCLGSGSLENVRVIYSPRSLPMFFFEVDSSKGRTGMKVCAAVKLEGGELGMERPPSVNGAGALPAVCDNSLTKVAALMSKIGSTEELVKKLQASKSCQSSQCSTECVEESS